MDHVVIGRPDRRENDKKVASSTAFSRPLVNFLAHKRIIFTWKPNFDSILRFLTSLTDQRLTVLGPEWTELHRTPT